MARASPLSACAKNMFLTRVYLTLTGIDFNFPIVHGRDNNTSTLCRLWTVLRGAEAKDLQNLSSERTIATFVKHLFFSLDFL